MSDKARSSEEPYSPDLSCYIPANFYAKTQPQHFGQHCSASCNSHVRERDITSSEGLPQLLPLCCGFYFAGVANSEAS